jgi:hypothetical protein
MVRGIVKLAMLVAIGGVVAGSLPDIKRYLRLRAM